ncbi:MAG: hypothetical protein ABR572_02950 [Cryomorphaceae bacterium]|nr:hypothetical protein [Flavobacteriales bacterium]
MRLGNFVIAVVTLSLTVFLPGCDGGPKTKVKVEPADREDDRSRPERDNRSEVNNVPRVETEDSVQGVIDTLATDAVVLHLDSSYVSNIEGAGEEDEGLSDDGNDTGEYDAYEDYSDEFLTDESEIAENRLVSSQVVRVISPELRDSYDSLLVVIEERLTIRPDPKADKVVLEKWKSPVNYRGYKFNMRKLMLFGVDVHYPVRVYFYMGQYYFSSGGELYDLEVFSDFSPFQPAADTTLSRYLQDFEN